MYSELYESKEREKRKDSLIFRHTTGRTASDFSHVFEGVCCETVATTPQLSEIICLNEKTGKFRINIPNAETKKKISLNAVKLKELYVISMYTIPVTLLSGKGRNRGLPELRGHHNLPKVLLIQILLVPMLCLLTQALGHRELHLSRTRLPRRTVVNDGNTIER